MSNSFTVGLVTPYLVTTLVNIASCVVVDSKHGNQPIGNAIRLKNKNHCKSYTNKKANQSSSISA